MASGFAASCYRTGFATCKASTNNSGYEARNGAPAGTEYPVEEGQGHDVFRLAQGTGAYSTFIAFCQPGHGNSRSLCLLAMLASTVSKHGSLSTAVTVIGDNCTQALNQKLSAEVADLKSMQHKLSMKAANKIQNMQCQVDSVVYTADEERKAHAKALKDMQDRLDHATLGQ